MKNYFCKSLVHFTEIIPKFDCCVWFSNMLLRNIHEEEKRKNPERALSSLRGYMTICHSIFCHSILLLMLYFLRMLYSWRCYPFYSLLTISKIESQFVSISEIFINFPYNCVFCHYYIWKNSFEFQFNSLPNWVMASPSKFLRVISAGPLNFLQRDFEKYSSSRKKIIFSKKS